MHEAQTYEPFAGPISLDNLDELLAHHKARFAGFTMEADDDGDEDELEVDDDGDQGDDENDDDDDEGDGDEPLGEAGKKALIAERARNKELRRQLREATAKGRKKDQGDDDGDAEEKAAAVWKPRVVNSAAKSALLEAGATKPERLLRLLDHDELDVTDTGDVQGLDDEVDRLKEEFPELFARPRRSGGRVETGDRGGSSTRKKLSATEKQAQSILGKG